MSKLEKIKLYIAKDDFEIIAEDYNIVIWVDWREYDEDIIQYCEDTINTGDLSAETVDNNKSEQGFDLYIVHNGVKHKVQYTGNGADRDTTIITLNEVLKPMYEIRFCLDSDGSDTLAFVTLSAKEWTELETDLGNNKVDYYFQKIEKDTKLFNISMNEMLERVEKRKKSNV